MDARPVICIQGATASGKSELAERIARKLDGEIISADSMQIYRGMDIGTAKLLPSERGVAYHCIDILDPGEPYSAALFQRDARAAISAIYKRDKWPILCGGTGFYVRAALDDLEFPPGEPQGEARLEYARLADALGPDGLHAYLAELDPDSAGLIHPNNVRRVIRALEMFDEGESYAKRKLAFKSVSCSIPNVKLALEVEREVLYERINARVDKMVEHGLIDEVRLLLNRGFRDGITAPQAIGYKEIVDYVDGASSLEHAVDSIKQASRRYAKRQLSWLRGDKEIIWLHADEGITDTLVEEALNIIERVG